MFNLKKYFSDELLQVALILSLLKIDRRSLEYNVPAVGIGTSNLTSTWDQSNILIRREGIIHPKSIDSLLLNYEHEVFHELNSLGRYNTIYDTLTSRNLTAYLLSVDEQQNTVEDSEEAASSVSLADRNTPDTVNPLHQKGIDDEKLSQEDLELIEALWKYDVEVEVSSSEFQEVETLQSGSTSATPPDEPHPPGGSSSLTPQSTNPLGDGVPRNISTVSASEEVVPKTNIKKEYVEEEELEKDIFLDDVLDSDPWLGSSCVTQFSDQERSVDVEQINENSGLVNDDNDDDALLSPAIFGSEFSLEELLQLIDLNEVDRHPVDFWHQFSVKTEASNNNAEEKEKKEEEAKEDPGIEADFLDDDLDHLTDFANMIHAPAPQYHHSRPFQSRSIPPYVRTMGMDHRWQDFANMVNFPSDTNHAAYHHHHHYHAAAAAASSSYTSSMASSYSTHHMQIASSVEGANTRSNLLHNTPLTGSITDLNNAQYSGLNPSCSVGSTVANSINLTNNTVADAVISTDSSAPAFKVEPSHQEAVYPYQNGCNEMNHTTEGFLSSILNDDDLQLMDMAVNEGMYSMRMLDNGCSLTQNCVERGTDSDSAVSSMGSERVPSLSSDTEWMETNSDSGHTPADHYTPDYCYKYRWHDNYMYGSRGPANGDSSPNNATNSRLSQIPQKKYQLYGRRNFQDQNSNHHVVHNHTYHVSPEAMNGATGTIQKPIFRDKMKSKSGRKSEDEQLTRDEKRARNLNIPISVYDIINLPMDEFNERLSKYDLSETQLSLIRDIRRRGKNKVAAQNCRKRKLDQITSLEEEVKMMKDRKAKLLNDREFLSMEKQKVQNKYVQLYRHIFSRLRENERQEFSLYEASMQQAANGSTVSLNVVDQSDYNSRSKNKDRKP